MSAIHEVEKMPDYSFSPAGEKFQLPTSEEYSKEFERLRGIVTHQRSLGREIVVVMGLGFVGAVMAAVVADAKDKEGILPNTSLACSVLARGVFGRFPC